MSATTYSFANWVFTLNNYTFDDCIQLASYHYALPQLFKFLMFSEEIGASGTRHLQGYFQLSKRQARPSLVQFFPNAYLAPAKGHYAHNLDYISKNNTQVVFKYGQEPAYKKKMDSNETARKVLQYISEGKEDKIREEFPAYYINKYSSIQKLLTAADNVTELPHEHRTIIFIHGPAGIGKSYLARRLVRDDNGTLYLKPLNKWWDGYSNQTHVLIDDLDPTFLSHSNFGSLLKHWGDIYPFQAEIKGSQRLIRPRKIIITSQYSLEELFPDPLLYAAISRRTNLTFLSPMFAAQYAAERQADWQRRQQSSLPPPPGSVPFSIGDIRIMSPSAGPRSYSAISPSLPSTPPPPIPSFLDLPIPSFPSTPSSPHPSPTSVIIPPTPSSSDSEDDDLPPRSRRRQSSVSHFFDDEASCTDSDSESGTSILSTDSFIVDSP